MTNMKIDRKDLQILYMHTRSAYNNITFERWALEVKKSYIDYCREREAPKTFSEWVNGQILAVAY